MFCLETHALAVFRKGRRKETLLGWVFKMVGVFKRNATAHNAIHQWALLNRKTFFVHSKVQYR